jgi:small GTP-binding protein
MAVQQYPRRLPSEQVHHTAKVVLAGDSGVGKTCVLVRFAQNEFLSVPYISTIGVDFKSKVVNVEGTKIRLQIWDTAGQERFRSITPTYFRDAVGLVLIYDITKGETFRNVRAWISDIKTHADGVIIMLLGNKLDVPDKERAVSFDEGQQLASSYGIPFLETSAKTGYGVMEAFDALARAIKVKLGSSNEKFDLSSYVMNVVPKRPEKKSCC